MDQKAISAVGELFDVITMRYNVPHLTSYMFVGVIEAIIPLAPDYAKTHALQQLQRMDGRVGKRELLELVNYLKSSCWTTNEDIAECCTTEVKRQRLAAASADSGGSRSLLSFHVYAQSPIPSLSINEDLRKQLEEKERLIEEQQREMYNLQQKLAETESKERMSGIIDNVPSEPADVILHRPSEHKPHRLLLENERQQLIRDAMINGEEANRLATEFIRNQRGAAAAAKVAEDAAAAAATEEALQLLRQQQHHYIGVVSSPTPTSASANLRMVATAAPSTSIFGPASPAQFMQRSRVIRENIVRERQEKETWRAAKVVPVNSPTDTLLPSVALMSREEAVRALATSSLSASPATSKKQQQEASALGFTQSLAQNNQLRMAAVYHVLGLEKQVSQSAKKTAPGPLDYVTTNSGSTSFRQPENMEKLITDPSSAGVADRFPSLKHSTNRGGAFSPSQSSSRRGMRAPLQLEGVEQQPVILADDMLREYAAATNRNMGLLLEGYDKQQATTPPPQHQHQQQQQQRQYPSPVPFSLQGGTTSSPIASEGIGGGKGVGGSAPSPSVTWVTRDGAPPPPTPRAKAAALSSASNNHRIANRYMYAL